MKACAVAGYCETRSEKRVRINSMRKKPQTVKAIKVPPLFGISGRTGISNRSNATEENCAILRGIFHFHSMYRAPVQDVASARARHSLHPSILHLKVHVKHA